MGHRGNWGYLYNGQYYIIYNTRCLPETLGKWLVSSVPSEPDAFKVWLAETQLFLDQVTDVDECENDVPNVLSRTHHAPSTSLESGAPNDHSFLYNLDDMVFTMDERIHFPLDNLPPYDEWITYIAEDGSATPCILPSTPDIYRLVADERMAPVDELSPLECEDLELYEQAFPQMIDKSIWCNVATPRCLAEARKLAKITFTGFISAQYSIISNISALFYELEFEDLAMELLTAAAPANSTFTSDIKYVSKIFCGCYSREGKYLLDPLPKKDRWAQDTFWFRGRLIVLVQSLLEEDLFKSKVGLVIRTAREKGLRKCTALLWSIHHVAVVEVEGQKVSHSEAIPVLAAFGKEEDALKRKFDEGVEFLMHYLSPIAVDGGVFMKARLPMDVFLRIMDFTDQTTSVMLGRTSKALRYEWVRHPWIGPFLISGSASGENEFSALLGTTGQPFKITVHPYECLRILDSKAIYKRIEEKKYHVYRLPFRFVDESDYRRRHGYFKHSGFPDFARIHAYEIQVEKADDGSFVSLPPKEVLKL
ncbi:hypothetical protein SCHPADRAFT_933537 [Schizopora paradoxa]|uniref:Uncharacterized protein n=1 Tax=Schizopora paradoxa TaxID=27342 RepID=A0A0H2R1K0_9AGAM|nr:hypothetical protein SCHPADRAFT_933537 [Schizopora paradoxa]